MVIASIEEFKNWVNATELYEIPLLGRKFTWYRNNPANRIERVFIDDVWLDFLNELKLVGLNRSILDHVALLVEFEAEDWGPNPFRNMDVYGYRTQALRSLWRE